MSDSMTIRVKSSMKSGTPSVRVAISSSTMAGSGLPPVTASTISIVSFLTSRSSATWLTYSRLIHSAGACSGRSVARMSSGTDGVCSTRRSRSSIVDGSIQCRSSMTKKTGLRAATSTTSWAMTCCVVSLFSRALTMAEECCDRGRLVMERSAATGGIRSSMTAANGASVCCTLRSFTASASDGSMPIQLSSHPMRGKNALF